MGETVTRQLLIDLVSAALESQPFVHAAWLEGADAAGRADSYSDIDVWADVDAGFEAQTFAAVRNVLLSLGPLDVDHDPVHPHPHLEQRFYRVAGLSPFWFVDICVQQHGRETVFPPHDPFKVLFDPCGVIQTTAVTDEAFVAEAVQVVLERAWWRRVLVLKEVHRGTAFGGAQILSPRGFGTAYPALAAALLPRQTRLRPETPLRRPASRGYSGTGKFVHRRDPRRFACGVGSSRHTFPVHPNGSKPHSPPVAPSP